MKSWLLKAAAMVKRMADMFDRDRVAVYAGEAAFFVLISTVPFIMLSILFLGAVYPIDAGSALSMAEDVLPEGIKNVGSRLMDEVINGSSSVPLVSVTTVLLLWPASKGIRAIGDGLQNVFDEDRRRMYIKNVFVSFAFTLLFIVLIAVAFFILVFGTQLAKFVASRLGVQDDAFSWLLSFKSLAFFPALTFLFALAYRLLARSEIPFRGQFFGAAVAAAGWLLYSYFFALYIEYFTDYSYLYGSLAALMIFMLWLYACMNMLLFGAVLNKLRWEDGKKTQSHERGAGKR